MKNTVEQKAENDEKNKIDAGGSGNTGLIVAVVILSLLFLGATGGFIYWLIQKNKGQRARLTRSQRRNRDLLQDNKKDAPSAFSTSTTSQSQPQQRRKRKSTDELTFPVMNPNEILPMVESEKGLELERNCLDPAMYCKDENLRKKCKTFDMATAECPNVLKKGASKVRKPKVKKQGAGARVGSETSSVLAIEDVSTKDLSKFGKIGQKPADCLDPNQYCANESLRKACDEFGTAVDVKQCMPSAKDVLKRRSVALPKKKLKLNKTGSKSLMIEDVKGKLRELRKRPADCLNPDEYCENDFLKEACKEYGTKVDMDKCPKVKRYFERKNCRDSKPTNCQAPCSLQKDNDLDYCLPPGMTTQSKDYETYKSGYDHKHDRNKTDNSWFGSWFS